MAKIRQQAFANANRKMQAGPMHISGEIYNS
jgi:hypothetical protein